MIPNQKMGLPTLGGAHLPVGSANNAQALNFDALADSFGSLLEKNSVANQNRDNRAFSSLEEHHASLLGQINKPRHESASADGLPNGSNSIPSYENSEDTIDMEGYLAALKKSLSEIDDAGGVREPVIATAGESGLMAMDELEDPEASEADIIGVSDSVDDVTVEDELHTVAEALLSAAQSAESEQISSRQIDASKMNVPATDLEVGNGSSAVSGEPQNSKVVPLVADRSELLRTAETAPTTQIGRGGASVPQLMQHTNVIAQTGPVGDIARTPQPSSKLLVEDGLANAGQPAKIAVSRSDAERVLSSSGENDQTSAAATIISSIHRIKGAVEAPNTPAAPMDKHMRSASSKADNAMPVIVGRASSKVVNAMDRFDLTSLNAKSEQSDTLKSAETTEEISGVARALSGDVSNFGQQVSRNATQSNANNSDRDFTATPLTPVPGQTAMMNSNAPRLMDLPIGDQVLDRVKPEILAMQRADLTSSHMQSVNPLLNKSVISLQLYPVGLGRLQALMQKENDTLKVELVVESRKTLDLLNADIDALKSSMRALGVADENITVTMARSNATNDALTDENLNFNLDDQRSDQFEKNSDGTGDRKDGTQGRQESASSILDQPAEIRVRTHDGVHRITI